ncbi:MAG: NAD(P)-dependent oxidoreductase [Alphaproteobacteria bacterium]|nr:NAD(P)-dependent oxidoreductase [Alphaproteobacteria bacterium]
MVTNRILLFGANGQVGRALQALPLPEDWDLRRLTPAECDFTSPSDIGKAFHDFPPDLAINAAEMNDLDACEINPDLAREVNFHAVAHIAGQCDTAGAPLIQLSTAHVFDGTESTVPYLPDDAMNPINVYGQTKMMGEEAARHGLYWHVILRASLVFSAHGDNILTRTLRQIDTQDDIQAAQDEIVSPTSAKAVAEALLGIAKAILNGKGDGFGTFHICSEPEASRFDFLQAVMQAYAPFTDRRPKLTPVPASAIPQHVLRPLYSALNGDKIREVYGIDSRLWHEDLSLAVKEYIETPSKYGQSNKVRPVCFCPLEKP